MFSPNYDRALTVLRLGGIACLLTSIASAHIRLITPNGGEVLSVGQTYRVEWEILVPHNQENWDVSYSVTGLNNMWIDIELDLPPGTPSKGSIHHYDWLVPNNISSDVYVRVTMDNPGTTTDYTDRSNSALSIVGCNSPSNYCSTSPNSVGAGATIGWTGTPNISTNGFVLTAAGAPPNKPGIFFYGGAQLSAPFGEGLRCVGSNGSEGIFRLGPPLVTDGAGQASYSLDVTSLPASMEPGSIEAGDTYNFQLWYRDPPGGPSGFNLTDGLNVKFCP